MKRTILLFTFLLTTVILSAQNIIIIRADRFNVNKMNPIEGPHWEGWEKCQNTITFNVGEATLKIDNNFHDEFKLIKNVISKTGADKDNGNWTETTYKAIDKKGVACEIMYKFRDSGILSVRVLYDNIDYVYQGELVSTL